MKLRFLSHGRCTKEKAKNMSVKVKSVIFIASFLLLGCAAHRGPIANSVRYDDVEQQNNQPAFYMYEEDMLNDAVDAIYLYKKGEPDIVMEYYYPLHLKARSEIETGRTRE